MATLITGATGFVGQHLVRMLDDPIVTSRNRTRAEKKLGKHVSEIIEWDPLKEPLPVAPDASIDCVINLMGESVAEGRWTTAKKQRIRDSRVTGTRNLIAGLRNLDRLPDSFISASAVGIYGTQPGKVLDETSDFGQGFLTDVCVEWEKAANEIAADGVRVALLRIGIVLGEAGGALEKMLPIFNLGIGGTLGNGKQFVPWIHVTDLANLFLWAARSDVSGPVNATAPNPVTNREMTKAIGQAIGRPTFIPAPKFLLKLALGEFAESLFFSQNVIPKVALDSGFEFAYSSIESAIKDLT